MDASVLAIGVALHDLGMYLSRDGFESLLADNSRWKGVEFFDRKSWKELWDDFHSEAARFDGRKLRQLFGNSDRPVRPLPANNAVWEDTDYLLVGEFLRRHHPRLAHEIALYGLPAKDGHAVEICLAKTEEQIFLADISGLVARSHGIDLRSCVDYLQQKYTNKIDPRGSHPIYLAALLRIADYFQIQASRAPVARTEVTAFRSRLSEQEWMVHQSVKDINNTSGDPEAIFVIAEPADVTTFLKLKNWINGLQKELDQTWAVLGELYGLQVHTGLNLLGLKIRRVRSNIDNVHEFASTVSYVPAHIAFEAANADLLKLLVAPLYGDDPGIGIRELFQNSIDAVREFNDTASQRANLASLSRYDQPADVVLEIKLDDKHLPAEVIICDRGIGMTSDVVQNYFLRAGASFRKSDAWRREHEDSDGQSRVLRTGRFGVGALAAFLLGDEIEVTTRHAFDDEDHALAFRARLDDEFISLNRTRAPVGTLIRIKIPSHRQRAARSLTQQSDELYYGSKIGHYFLREPSLLRRLPGGKTPSPKHWLPQPDEDFSKDWRWFESKGFQRIFWTYGDGFPTLSSNGIVIEASVHVHSRFWRFLEQPKLSVFDREGSLPVNLQRNGLQQPIPFKDDLLCSICDDLIAHALVEAPEQCESIWFRGSYEGISRSYEDWPAWLIGRNGFVLYEPFLVGLFNPRTLVIALGGDSDLEGWGRQVQSELGADGLLLCLKPRIFDDTHPRNKGQFLDLLSGYLGLPDWLNSDSLATYIPRVLLDKINTLRPGKLVSRALKRVDVLPELNGWKQMGKLPADLKSLHEAIVSLPIDQDNPVTFSIYRVEVDIQEDLDRSMEKSLSDHWIKVLGTHAIPFSRKSRNQLEAKSSDEVKKLLKLRRMPRKKETEGTDDDL